MKITIIDLEWYEVTSTESYPTQLAGIRLNEEMEIISQIHLPIYPEQPLARVKWDHLAFTGFGRCDYEKGPDSQEAFIEFAKWLHKYDKIFIWEQPQYEVFRKMYRKYIGHWPKFQPLFARSVLEDLFYDGLGYLGSPYTMGDARQLQFEHDEHNALCDTKAILALFKNAGATPSSFNRYDPNRSAPYTDERKYQRYIGQQTYKYYYDPLGKLLHRNDCQELLFGTRVQGYNTIKACIKEKYHPCDCCREEYYQYLKDDRIRIIQSCQYNYMYLPQSDTFHKWHCSILLNSKYGDLRGAIKYETALATGRTPCKHCNPSPNDEKRVIEYAGEKITVQPRYVPPKKEFAKPGITRDLTRSEKNAYARYEQSLKDMDELREQQELTKEDATDKFTLSQTRYAFWSAAGYGNFHRRDCPKLLDLHNLRGFALYDDAIRAGLTPCKVCKPTRQNEARLSIPITNRVQENETPDTIMNLCRQAGYLISYKKPILEIKTKVGQWRLDVFERPLVLEHINLTIATSPWNDYHEQPRRFLSLKDVYDYIKRHDDTLLQRNQTSDI